MSDPKEFDGDAPRLQRSQAADPRDPGIVRLLSLLESSTEGSRELDDEIAFVLSAAGEHVPCGRTEHAGKLVRSAARYYTTSLDAALSLVIGRQRVATEIDPFAAGHRAHATIGGVHFGHAATVPLALCIAAIKARISESPQ